MRNLPTLALLVAVAARRARGVPVGAPRRRHPPPQHHRRRARCAYAAARAAVNILHHDAAGSWRDVAAACARAADADDIVDVAITKAASGEVTLAQAPPAAPPTGSMAAGDFDGSGVPAVLFVYICTYGANIARASASSTPVARLPVLVAALAT